ncbi:unnamed protein product [Camellia sinensis]
MLRTRGDKIEKSSTARMDRMERLIQEMAETLSQQQEWQQQWQQPHPPLPPPVPPVLDLQNDDRIIALTKEFKKMKPPQFHGGLDPLKVEAWVIGIENLFEVFPCSETQKVLLATFMLEDEARRWWMLMRENHKDVDLTKFLEIFNDKYFSQCVRDRKVSEFMELKQDSMTVAEYEAKFTELARFTPHVIDSDYKKARHFEGGLRSDILKRVNVLKLETYIGVLDRAIISEANIARQAKSTTDWKGNKSPCQKLNNSSLAASLANSGSPLQKREKLYLLAVGYYRSGEYGRSRQLAEQCLEIAPNWMQALTLKKTIDDQITNAVFSWGIWGEIWKGKWKDGVIGIGIIATVVGLVAGGIAASLARKN